MVTDNYFVQLPQLEFTQYVLINTFRSRLHVLNMPPQKGRKQARDFSGSPVVKMPSFQIKVHGIRSLIRELRYHTPPGMAKNKPTNGGGGERVNLLWGNLTNITSAKWSRSMMSCQVDSESPWNIKTITVFYLHDHCLQNPETQSNYQENMEYTPREAPSPKYLTSHPQNCQGHQRQGKSEKLSQPREI